MFKKLFFNFLFIFYFLFTFYLFFIRFLYTFYTFVVFYPFFIHLLFFIHFLYTFYTHKTYKNEFIYLTGVTKYGVTIPRSAAKIFDRSRSFGRTALAAESQRQVFCEKHFQVTRKVLKFAWGFFLQKITTKK